MEIPLVFVSPPPVIEVPAFQPTAVLTPTVTPGLTPTLEVTATLMPGKVSTSTVTSAPGARRTPMATLTPDGRPTLKSIDPFIALALTTPTRTAEALPTPSPTFPSGPELRGKIAFPLFDPERGVYDLYVANVDGSGRHRIVEEASQPAFSPDGSQIAFRSWQHDALGLMVADAEGGAPRQITAYAEDALPSWSRDVPILAFCSQREPGRRWRIYGVVADGQYEWALERGNVAVFGQGPTWLPESRIAYAGCVDGHCGIILMYGDGSNPLPLTTDPKDTAPAASPDGSGIAFMSNRDDNWEVYIVGADGEGLTRLTDEPAADGLPTWSPDGQSVAFVSNRSGVWAVWVMNADGSQQRMLFELGGGFGNGERDWTSERISWGP